jgi:hypothetical protein
MRNARRVIKCLIANDQIEMQYLKKLNRFRWRCSLNQTMHFWNRTRIALNDFRSIFLNYFNFIDFLIDWSILIDNVLIANVNFKKSSSLKSSCETELHWRTFQRIDISTKTNRVFFSMSHIITLIDLIINAFLYMSHTKSCFLKQVTKIKITSINDTKMMLSKNILRFFSLMRLMTSIVSYSSINMKSFDVSIISCANVISLKNRFKS